MARHVLRERNWAIPFDTLLSYKDNWKIIFYQKMKLMKWFWNILNWFRAITSGCLITYPVFLFCTIVVEIVIFHQFLTLAACSQFSPVKLVVVFWLVFSLNLSVFDLELLRERERVLILLAYYFLVEFYDYG